MPTCSHMPVSRLLKVIMSASRPAAFISSYTCSALSRRPPFSHADIKACWQEQEPSGTQSSSRVKATCCFCVMGSGGGAHRVCDGVRHAVGVLPGCLLLFPKQLDGLFPLVAQRRDQGLQRTHE